VLALPAQKRHRLPLRWHLRPRLLKLRHLRPRHLRLLLLLRGQQKAARLPVVPVVQVVPAVVLAADLQLPSSLSYPLLQRMVV
jgi:hypothetical protein